ncbi:MAG TPA: hypothetical protein ENJ69_02550 [Bacteroidetes bacterium]|nr:hypothetical protein [Bacteroidota bacterium]
MSKTFKTVLLLAVVLVFGACNTKKNADPYYKISDEFKQYCLFQKQSEWTYQNDSTGALYSLNISDISSYIAFHSPDNTGGPYSFDVIDMIFDTATRLDIFKGSITAGNPTTGTGTMTDLYWLFFKNGNYLLAFAPGYPMGEEQRLGDNPGFYTNVELLPDFSLNGKSYSDVYHTQVRKTEGTSDTVNYQFYFARHYGLIKWTRRVKGETTSYSLTKSNLTQK